MNQIINPFKHPKLTIALLVSILLVFIIAQIHLHTSQEYHLAVEAIKRDTVLENRIGKFKRIPWGPKGFSSVSYGGNTEKQISFKVNGKTGSAYIVVHTSKTSYSNWEVDSVTIISIE